MKASIKKHKRSLIWTIFNKRDDTLAECILCRKDIKYCGGTQNLWQHAQRHHETEFKDFKEAERLQQGTESGNTSLNRSGNIVPMPVKTESASNPKPKIRKSGSAYVKKSILEAVQKKMKDGLMYLIAKDLQPASIVEDPGFIEYTNRLNPSFTLPSQRVLSQWLSEKYEEVRNLTRQTLEKLDVVSLTFDTWTNHAAENYITITAHGISDNFESVNVVLDTVFMPENLRGEDEADILMRVLDDWHIKGKIYAFVTENTSTAAKCVSKLFQKGYGGLHVWCTAHTIQLCIDEVLGLEQVSQMLKRCSDTVSLFHNSTVLTEALKNSQKKLNFPSKELIQAVPTKWSSTFDMFVRLLEQQKAIQLALCSYKHKGAVTTVKTSDYCLMRKLVELLAPFKEAAIILSGNNYVMSSFIHPLLEHCIKVLDEAKHIQEQEMVMRNSENDRVTMNQSSNEADGEVEGSEFNALAGQIRESLRNNILNRFQSVLFDPVHQVSTYLDPRFKVTYENVAAVVEEVKSQMWKALQSQCLMSVGLASGIVDGGSGQCPSNACLPNTTEIISWISDFSEVKPATLNSSFNEVDYHPRPSFWHNLKTAQDSAKKMRLSSERVGSDDMELKIAAELSAYNAMEMLEIAPSALPTELDEDSNVRYNDDQQRMVLEFWRNAHQKLSTLSIIARRFLSIPATSVASQHVYSKTGRIISDRRASLNPRNVQELTFLNCNWRL